jgi:hypothetical protein
VEWASPVPKGPVPKGPGALANEQAPTAKAPVAKAPGDWDEVPTPLLRPNSITSSQL